jgi:uncharacterized membrane protein YeaQ/YmgE (transglycosylase-associated protein family)
VDGSSVYWALGVPTVLISGIIIATIGAVILVWISHMIREA